MPTGLRLALSYLCNYKFRRNFRNYINPTCHCSLEIETTTHFLCYFSLFQSARKYLLIKFTKIDIRFLEKHNEFIKKYLVYDRDQFDLSCNHSIMFVL